MGDRLVVDVSQLARLSNELTAAADELRAQAARFASNTGTTGGAYGNLPVSQQAALEHDQLTRDALLRLAELEGAYRDQAAALRTAAREFEATEAANIEQARRLG